MRWLFEFGAVTDFLSKKYYKRALKPSKFRLRAGQNQKRTPPLYSLSKVALFVCVLIWFWREVQIERVTSENDVVSYHCRWGFRLDIASEKTIKYGGESATLNQFVKAKTFPDDSNETSSGSQDHNASFEKNDLELQRTTMNPKANDQQPTTASGNPEGTGFHFLTHDYLSEKVTQDSINEIIDNLPKTRSDLLEYLVKNDGTVVCKWCGEVLPSRTHWYRHKYKLHVPTTGLPAGLIKCVKCNTFFKSRKGYVGHCVTRHGSVEEAEKEDDEEHIIVKEEGIELYEDTNVEEVLANIEKEEQNRRNNKFVEHFGRGRKRNQIKDERREDYLKQREKEEKLVAEIIAKVKKECEDQSITMCRRGYSRRSTVMTSFREYDKRK